LNGGVDKRGENNIMSTNLFLSAISNIDKYQDDEKFYNKRQDICINIMWICVFLHCIFSPDIIFSSDSITRHILFSIAFGSWFFSIIMWIMYFVKSLRIQKKIMNSMELLKKQCQLLHNR
jgi:hypothetical protein